MKPGSSREEAKSTQPQRKARIPHGCVWVLKQRSCVAAEDGGGVILSVSPCQRGAAQNSSRSQTVWRGATERIRKPPQQPPSCPRMALGRMTI